MRGMRGIIVGTPKKTVKNNSSSKKLCILLKNTRLKAQLVVAIFRWAIVTLVCSKSLAIYD